MVLIGVLLACSCFAMTTFDSVGFTFGRPPTCPLARAASNPALNGCLSQTTTQSCNGATWTFTVNVDNSANGLTTYTSIDAARLAAKQAQKPLTGAQIKVTAAGSVALLPGVSTGMYGLSLPQIGVQGQSAMVIL